MTQLSSVQILNFKKIIKKFPQIKTIVNELNQTGIQWAIAAGSAFFVYTGGNEEAIDDVDIWIAGDSKEKTAVILKETWIRHSSERHTAENIEMKPFDIFTNCRKYKDGKKLLDYLWTNSVTDNLRKAIIEGIDYQIVSPEDIVILKIPNPRSEKEMLEVKKLIQFGLNKKYLEERLKECNATEEVYKNLSILL